jgi:predicted nucleotidyltransferase
MGNIRVDGSKCKGTKMVAINLGVTDEQIASVCRQWKVTRLAVFGSAAAGKLRTDSDIDLLVTFAQNAEWSMFDHYRMEEELTKLFGREVDLVSIKAAEESTNPICRREILESARQIYAAG